jgi:hypothetical protein
VDERAWRAVEIAAQDVRGIMSHTQRMGTARQLSDLSQFDEPSLRVPQNMRAPKDQLLPSGSVNREKQQSNIILPRIFLQPDAKRGILFGRGLDAVDVMAGQITEFHLLRRKHIEACSPHKQRDAIALSARPPLVQSLHAVGCELRTQPLERRLFDLLQREHVRV